jgi:hypothetical protein
MQLQLAADPPSPNSEVRSVDVDDGRAADVGPDDALDFSDVEV